MSDGKTTVTLTDEERERLEDYEHDDHYRVGEAVGMLMDVVPTLDDIGDGCTNCGEGPRRDGPIDQFGGVIQHMHLDPVNTEGAWTEALWFCSPECVIEFEEERQKAIPSDPDKVVVGGKDELRTTISDASFIMDGRSMQVGLDVPGAFAGETTFGGELDYIGEPVWVYKDGKVRQSGVIEDIFHEEAHTTLGLEHDYLWTALCHPDEEQTEEFLEEWQVGTHTPCGRTIKAGRDSEFPFDCIECGEEVPEDEWEEHELSVRE